MLEAGVKMRLFLEIDNLLEMRVVYVGINAEQTFEYRLNNFFKIWGKWCS